MNGDRRWSALSSWSLVRRPVRQHRGPQFLSCSDVIDCAQRGVSCLSACPVPQRGDWKIDLCELNHKNTEQNTPSSASSWPGIACGTVASASCARYLDPSIIVEL